MTPDEIERYKELLEKEIKALQQSMDATEYLAQLDNKSNTLEYIAQIEHQDEELDRMLDHIKLLKNARKCVWLRIIMEDYS